MHGVIDVLKKALELEQVGFRFYSESADNVSSRVVEAVLRSLANDENEHIRMIEQFYNAVQKGHNWPVVDFSSMNIETADKRIVELMANSTEEISSNVTYENVYIIARDKELASRDFYDEQKRMHSDEPELSGFFNFLRNMEEVHMNMLNLLVQGSKNVAGN